LQASVFPWAHFPTTKTAVKMHTLRDLQGNIPRFIHISDGKMADVHALDLLLPEPGAIYVMDSGYVDFVRLHAMHRVGAFFVTRTKSNMKAHRVYSAETDRTTGIICDQSTALDGHYTSQHYPEHLPARVRFKEKKWRLDDVRGASASDLRRHERHCSSCTAPGERTRQVQKPPRFRRAASPCPLQSNQDVLAVLIAVEDSGPGIAPETMDHLFEAFFTTKPSGMGIGFRSVARSSMPMAVASGCPEVTLGQPEGQTAQRRRRHKITSGVIDRLYRQRHRSISAFPTHAHLGDAGRHLNEAVETSTARPCSAPTPSAERYIAPCRTASKPPANLQEFLRLPESNNCPLPMKRKKAPDCSAEYGNVTYIVTLPLILRDVTRLSACLIAA
jgi:Transposase DDE domain